MQRHQRLLILTYIPRLDDRELSRQTASKLPLTLYPSTGFTVDL